MRKAKIVVPYPDPQPAADAAYKLAYRRPANINVVGSFPLQTMVKAPELFVDMVVTMPASILEEKDYLNYRYIYKRAYYLACLAAGLDRSLWDLKYSFLNGNNLQPILLAKGVMGTANDFFSSKCIIRIIPAAPEGVFPPTKIRLHKNAIRPSVLLNISDGHDAKPVPTPFYNSTIQSETTYLQYLKLFQSTTKKVRGYKESCILGRIWLQQRGFGSSLAKGGFGTFEWAALTALLLQGGDAKGHGVLSPEYSSFQLFKALLQYLASTDLAARPFIFQATGIELSKSDSPVLFDGPRGLNILFKMSPSSYASICAESKLSLEMLNYDFTDQFEATFIMKKDISHYRFDSVIVLDAADLAAISSSPDHLDDQRRLSLKAYHILKEGLGDRVESIHITGTDGDSWSLSSSHSTSRPSLLVGVVFNPSNIDRLVDLGPSADEKQKAVRFQKFWGEKAELRRFKDGSILESLVWSGKEGSVFHEIVSYLTKRHLKASPTFLGDGFSQLLLGSVGDEPFKALKEAFRKLDQDIRALEELPLQLRSISPVGSQLRFSSVKTPLFTPQQHLRSPAEVMIQFEGSGRWPDDVIAIQRTKMAFLLKIGSLLEDSVDGLTTKVGLEHSDRPLANCGYVDVTYPSGAVFRLRIQNDREQALLERMIKDKSTENHSREEALAALSMFKQAQHQLPLVTQSIATHCTRFPLLSQTIRLVKMWFESHMLSEHIPEVVVELLVIRTFLQPYPWKAPSSAGTGFLRTLDFIARWDWRITPLVVDFSGTMTIKDVASASTRLEAWRKIDPAMNRVVLLVVTSHDATGTVFTDGSPSKMIAARMTALARSATALVKEKAKVVNPKLLFKTTKSNFDFIIHIAPTFSGSRRGTKQSKSALFKNIELQKTDEQVLVGYEPVRLFVSELQKLYGDSIVFLHDRISNNVICGLWNPQATARSFRVNLSYATRPIGNGDEEVDIDKTAILSEISRLGGNMVSKVEEIP